MTRQSAIIARLCLVAALATGVAGGLVAGMPSRGDAPATVGTGGPAEATYLVPVDQTYGISACLGSDECGADAARAFCQSKGLPASGSYARAADDASFEVGCRA